MTIEERLNSLKEAFTGKAAEAEASSAELAKAKEALEAKDGELKAALDLAAATNSAMEKMAAKIAELEGALAEASKNYKALEASFETAGKKAAKIAASVGVEPVEVSPAESVAVKTDEEIAQEWALLKKSDPKAAQKFYDLNKSALLRAAGLR
jgi:predicted RNase H-like nuclease (RuvC/YqgF family)